MSIPKITYLNKCISSFVSGKNHFDSIAVRTVILVIKMIVQSTSKKCVLRLFVVCALALGEVSSQLVLSSDHLRGKIQNSSFIFLLDESSLLRSNV